MTFTSFLMSGINVLFGVYISNKIGSEVLGIFQLVTSVFMFFITFATSGINLAATRVVTEELVSNGKKGAKTALKQCIKYSMFLGTLSAIILFVSSDFIVQNWIHDKLSSIPLRIFAISLPFIAISSSLGGYFRCT